MLFFALICALACVTAEKTKLDFTKLQPVDWIIKVNADKMTNDRVHTICKEVKPALKAEDFKENIEAAKKIYNDAEKANLASDKIVDELAKLVKPLEPAHQKEVIAKNAEGALADAAILDTWFKDGCEHPNDKVSKHIIEEDAHCKEYFKDFPEAAKHVFTKEAVAAWQKEEFWKKCDDAWFLTVDSTLKKEEQAKFLKNDGAIKLTDPKFFDKLCALKEWRDFAAKDTVKLLNGGTSKTSSFALYGATVTVALLAFIF